MLDTLREVETPEGVALCLRPAGVFARALAWVVDLAVCCVILGVASGLFRGIFGANGGAGLLLLLLFIMDWGYDVVCDIWFAGQTPGKRMMELRVISADGAPVSALQSVVRNLLRCIDFLPLFYGVGLTASLADGSSRRIGDIIAGTMVVHVQQVASGAAVPLRPAEPLPVSLSEEEQAAIIAFAERAPHLNLARQAELADILEPLTGHRGTPGAERLTAYANGLLGRP